MVVDMVQGAPLQAGYYITADVVKAHAATKRGSADRKGAA